MSDIRVEKSHPDDHGHVYIYDRYGSGYVYLEGHEVEFVKERLEEILEG